MASSGKSAQQFIQGAFSPTVAVLCAPSVNNVLSKNNLTFPELLQPFTTMNWEGQLREPGGSVCTVKNWKLVIKDANWKPLQPTEARRQLNNSALLNFSDNCSSLEIDGRQFDIPQSTPWFDAWRDTYLEVQFPSDHEFAKAFISSMLVVTSHDDQIIQATTNNLKKFVEIIHSTPAKLPIWFNGDMPSCYVMLHDVSAVPKEVADEKFLTMQRTYGANKVFMLPINSKAASDPHLPIDYWAPYIKRTTDMNNDVSTTLSNVQASPIESQPLVPPPQSSIFPPPNSEDNPIISAIQEVLHPLTTTDNDVYDNANSLQTHSFSGSSESMNVAGRSADTEVHGAALNANDVDAIQNFLKEFCKRELLPHIEKLISEISEVVANRKGVSRSLLHKATRRWFGTGKGGNATGNSAVVYTNDCPELQLRRLGDLWFLCGQWQRAYDVYHTAKREFYDDSAWLCYAGALEMAALSAFMAGESNRKTHAYMEESIITYLNTCRMVQYAVRASLFSVACLSGSGLHGEAAKQLIRMTSEDSDLRSAMLLEQASLCFFAGPGSKAMTRKYAFHMVLAGHRFSKAGQKKHAYRCYEQAYQVYSESGWRLATDHVQFALGRLAGALRQPREAAGWLAAPLAPSARQPARQQDAFLKEYMLAHQQWVDQSEEFKHSLPVLPLPLLQSECTAVLCVGPAPLSSPGRSPATSISLQHANNKQDDIYWHKLEEMLLQVAQGSVPMIFKPSVDLYTVKTDRNPTVPQGEPIQIAITLWNPLKITLAMKDVELLWKFVPSTQAPESPKGDVLSNEPAVASGSVLESNVICGQKIKSVLWEGDSKKVLTFTLTPLQVGHLSIQGVSYKLLNMGEGGIDNSGSGVTILGKLNFGSGVHSSDKCLQINVVPHAPCLQMTFSETSRLMISGEMQEIDVEFRNVGSVEMRNVHVAVSRPDCVALLAPDEGGDHFKQLYEDKYREPLVFQDERAARLAFSRQTAARHARLVSPLICSGGSARARLLLRPTLPRAALQLLAYYEGSPHSHRLLRHVFHLNVTEAVEVSVTPRRSLRKIADDITENMNLAIEIKNVSNEKDEDISVEVLEASLLSRQWKLTDLTIADRGELLTCRERLHLVLRAKRILSDLPKNFVDYSCVKVAEDHPDSINDINTAPYSKFVNDFKPNIGNSEVTEFKKTNNATDLIQSMFVVRWKAHDKKNNKTAVGQHCLWLEGFKKTESRDKQHLPGDLPTLLDDFDNKLDIKESKSNIATPLSGDVVVFRIEHSNHIYHNFEKTKLCSVPITLNVVNCYGDPVKIFINLSKQPNGGSKGELGWAGALCAGSGEESNELGVRIDLDKFEARRVQLSALCAEPGTYPVGSSFAVTSTRGQENAHMQFTNNTSLLVVQQAA